MATFSEELEGRLGRYIRQRDERLEEVERLNALISHAQALLAAERESQAPQAGQIALADSNGRAPVDQIRSVAKAVEVALGQNVTRFSDIARQIETQFPYLAPVRRQAVSSALRHGVKTGKYTNPGRGQYRLARTEGG